MEYEEFIKMTTDSSFDKILLTDFWYSISITKEYESLAKKAVLPPFAITYICVKLDFHHNMHQQKQNITIN